MAAVGGIFSPSSSSTDQSARGTDSSAFVKRLPPCCASGLGKTLAVQGDLLWCHWLSRREGFQRNLDWSHICSSSTRRLSCRPGGKYNLDSLKETAIETFQRGKSNQGKPGQ